MSLDPEKNDLTSNRPFRNLKSAVGGFLERHSLFGKKEHNLDPFNDKFGLYTEGGLPIFESPSPTQLQRLLDNPRIEYFSYTIPNDEKTFILSERLGGMMIPNKPKVLRPGLVTLPVDDRELLAMRGQRHTSERLFDRYVTKFLIPHMKSEIGKKLVGLRGTTCSIDGPINVNGLEIMDIEEVLLKGNEHLIHNEAPMTGFSDESEDIHHRTHQWLIEGTENLRQKLKAYPDQASKIFPVLLVYDQSMMVFEESGTYGKIFLPTDPEKASRAIIKAYVFDYPG